MTTLVTPEAYLMPLDALISNYSPVYPDESTWDDTVKYLLGNPADLRILNELMRQHRQSGGFREPVLLEVSEDMLDESLQVLNGTHRVVASILLEASHILVHHDSSSPYDPDEAWSHATTIITFKELKDGEDDILFDILRSFALDDDTWVTASAMSGTKEYLHIWWDNEPTAAFETRYHEINTHLLETITSNNIDISGLEVNTITQVEEA